MSKRRRRVEEEAEAEVEPEEREERTSEASSSSAAKKSRTSSVNAAAEDVENMEDEEEAGPSEVDCSQMPDFNSQSSEVGLLEQVTLRNFMCHSYLEVKFGPNVNFVIGRNGSGKSAIMTGIVVGLGGKASATSRGSSLKGFIQNKAHTALITIKLRNQGEDAYKPSVYGPSVIVERKISHDGCGSYKIKSHDGKKVVSTKKEELINILDQFNIQVDNPVSLLNQDTSRNFLCTSNPEDKYKFFLKATQLEQMSNDYLKVVESKTIIKDTIKRKEQTLSEMEEELRRLEDQYKDIAQIKEMKDIVDQRLKEVAWAQVYEVEKQIPPHSEKVRKLEAGVPKYDEKIEVCVRNIAKSDEEREVHQQQLIEIGEEAKVLQEEREGINAELKKKKSALKDKQSQLRKVRHDIHTNSSDKQQLLDRITEIRNSAMEDREAERQRRETELNSKREEQKALIAQLSTTNHHRGQLDAGINRAREQEYSMRTDVEDLRRNLQSATKHLQDLQGSRENKLKVFGSWVPALLNRIQDALRRNRFHKPPKGPIGSALKIRDEKWALAAERAIKGTAFAFCCHDFHDAEVLRTLVKQTCPPKNHPSIIVSKFVDQVYDVSGSKPRCPYPTVLDLLEIEDPVVANFVIDQTRIESILLIENPKEARQFMFQHNLPRNVRVAYDIKGDQLIGGSSAKVFSNSRERTVYLKGNIESEISSQEQVVERIKQELDGAMARQQELRAEIDRNKKELDRARRKGLQEQDCLNKLQLDIQELESYEEEQLPDISTLEEEVQMYDEVLQDLNDKLKVAEEEYETANEAVQKQEIKSRQRKEKIETLLEKADPIKNRLHAIDVEIVTQKSHKKHYVDKKTEHMAALDRARKDHEAVSKKAKEMAETAAQFCDKVETNRKVSDLEKEIMKYRKRIKEEEKNKGKHEEITVKFYNAKKTYQEVTEKMQSLNNFAKKMDKMMEERSKSFSHYRQFIAIRAKYYFQMMLSQRGYTGKMKFNHEKESLSLHVNVESGKSQGSKDNKSLSGGERSFSTVSFIMALWEAMESPFRMLDEFDVFMDMVNRRIVMDMMMKAASDQHTRQFVFLTPQDMSRVGGGANVRIFQLADPERGQSTLPFQPQ